MSGAWYNTIKKLYREEHHEKQEPSFEITNAIIVLVAEIAELMGKLSSANKISANSTLRRMNRICTIHGSLAVEQNTLTLE